MDSQSSASSASSAELILIFLSKRDDLLLSLMQEGARANPAETKTRLFSVRRREDEYIWQY
jgi:hypothetical protein